VLKPISWLNFKRDTKGARRGRQLKPSLTGSTFKRRSRISQALIEILQHEIGWRAVEVSRRIRWLDLDRLFTWVDCCRDLPLLESQFSQLSSYLRRPRTEVNASLQRLGCARSPGSATTRISPSVA
jgi:hypothetical protein